MKRRFLIVLIALFLFAFISPASANEYTYRDGYYWCGTQAYTRYWVSPSYYYSCGRWIQYAEGYWAYTPISVAVSTTITPADGYSGAVSKLLDVAKQRDKYELQNRKLAVEHSAILQMVDALGLKGNFAISGYGQSLLYPGYGYPFTQTTANLGTYGANADSLYGYSYSQIQQAYGSTDMNTLYQQAARNTQSAQSLGAQANTEFSGLVSQAGDNQARVAEILAKAQAAKIALDAANPQSSKTTQTQVSVTGTSAAPNTVSSAGDDSALFLKNVAVPLCASCHSGGTVKGGFDVTQYPSLPLDKKVIVWGRLFDHDPARRMPKGKDLGPGAPLTGEQLRQFVTH